MAESGANEVDNTSSDDLRQMGNHQFAQGKYDVACALYTTALELVGKEYVTGDDSSSSSKATPETPPPPSLLLLLCNRSAAYYKMEKYEESRKDADLAWQLDPHISNIKAAYRLAKTLLAMDKFEEAKDVILSGLAVLDEVDAEAKKKAEHRKMEKMAKGELVGKDEKEGEEEEDENAKNSKVQRKAFEDLFKTLEKKQKNDGKEPPKISIRDFQMGDELGFGNFSEIYKVTHKQTNREFALKRINKKKVSDLAARQVSKVPRLRFKP